MQDESFLALGQWGLLDRVHLKALGEAGLKKKTNMRLEASHATGIP